MQRGPRWTARTIPCSSSASSTQPVLPAVAMARQDPAAFFAYLDVHPGQTVLDAGCGLGEMVGLIAGLVGPSGRVVGIDFSETMVRKPAGAARGRTCRSSFARATSWGWTSPTTHSIGRGSNRCFSTFLGRRRHRRALSGDEAGRTHRGT